MRKFLLLLAAVAAVVIAVVIVAVHRPATDQRSSTGTAPTSVPSSTSASDERDLQDLLNTRLSTTGAQLSVGLPATLTIDAANGDTVYARVTMDELRKLPTDQIRVPLRQMIFVGDGYTDIPCFSLLKQNGGMPIAVYDKHREDKWGNAFQFVRDGRVANLHSANYAEDSDLSTFLVMAVRSLATDVALAAGRSRLLDLSTPAFWMASV